MPTWNGRWQGGRTYLTADGRTVWVIQKRVDGKVKSITLDVADLKSALAELALFERDRAGYLSKTKAAAQALADAVVLDDETINRFTAFLANPPDGRPRTPLYIANLKSYLGQWRDAFHGRDLRTLTLRDYQKPLASWAKGYHMRIVAIKSFTSFLREHEATLKRAEDASLDLRVPAPKPERLKRDKGYSMKTIERLYRICPEQAVRDCIMLHAKLGMHATEIERVALGDSKISPVPNHGEIAATLTYPHKNGSPHKVSVDAQTLAAIERLQKRGSAPVATWIRKVLTRAIAAENKNVPEERKMKFVFLGEIRHSYVAWCSEFGTPVHATAGVGVPLATVAAILGHRSPMTTSKFYDVTPVPVMIKIPLKLTHPEDPVPLVARDSSAVG
jgi:integrase